MLYYSLTPDSCFSPSNSLCSTQHCLLCSFNTRAHCQLCSGCSSLWKPSFHRDPGRMVPPLPPHLRFHLTAYTDHFMEHCCLPTCPPAPLTVRPALLLVHAPHSSNRHRLCGVEVFSICSEQKVPFQKVSSVEIGTLFFT